MMLGIDLGGTKIAYAVVHPGSATIVARLQTETRSTDGAAAVLARMIDDCTAAAPSVERVSVCRRATMVALPG